jgi:DNA-binding SARP family transcriptional activator
MNVQRPPTHSASDAMPEACSPQDMLQQGITAIAQGHDSEGMALLVHARDTLIMEQSQYLLLDTIIQHYASYTQAQEALLDASRTFAQAHSNLYTSIGELEQHLLQSGQNVQAHSLIIEHVLTQQKPASLLPMPTSTLAHKETDKRAARTSIESEYLPELSITCFGRFEVRRHGQLVTLCQNRNGQAIFRYLIAQPNYRATMDNLIEALWPNEEPGVARRKLQVAISALRRSLNAGYACDAGGGYILCKQHLYLLNPAVRFTTDVDEFLQSYERGRHAQEDEMVRQYEHACRLYTGPLLVEDRYTDWSIGRREQMSQVYLSMCAALAEQAFKRGVYENAISWATALLAENACDEAAHRLLIRAYARLGRRNEALKQYQRCERILFDELGVTPMPETVRLFENIVTHIARE